jgi:hypothetical protein
MASARVIALLTHRVSFVRDSLILILTKDGPGSRQNIVGYPYNPAFRQSSTRSSGHTWQEYRRIAQPKPSPRRLFRVGEMGKIPQELLVSRPGCTVL